MECGSQYALVGIQENFKITEGRLEIACPEIAAGDKFSCLGRSCAHHVIRRRQFAHENEFGNSRE